MKQYKMSDFQAIIKDIKKKAFAPVYILMGEEPYYIDRITETLEANVVPEENKEFDQTIIYGADTGGLKVLEAASQYPMFSNYRLVILKEAQSMVRAKAELDKIAPYLSYPGNHSILVIAYKSEKIGASSALIKAAKKNKDIVIFESPKIKDHNIAGVVKSHCAAKKISMDDKAVEVLINNVGNSLTNLFSEIDKLRIGLKNGDSRNTAEMVHDQIGISREFNNFELTSALARRDYLQSIKIIKYFEKNPKANLTVVTISVIFSFFQRLLLAAFSQDKNDNALMEALQLKTPYALKDIRIGLNTYNASQLVRAIHAIRLFDTRSKGINSYQKEFSLLLELVCTLVTL